MNMRCLMRWNGRALFVTSFLPAKAAHLRILGVRKPLLQAAIGSVAAIACLCTSQLVLGSLHCQLGTAGTPAAPRLEGAARVRHHTQAAAFRAWHPRTPMHTLALAARSDLPICILQRLRFPLTCSAPTAPRPALGWPAASWRACPPRPPQPAPPPAARSWPALPPVAPSCCSSCWCS